MAIENSSASKDLFRHYGIFLSFLIVIFGILFGMSILNKKFYSNGIKEEIQKVLNQQENAKYIIGKELKITSGIVNSAVLFELSSSESAEKYYALMLRTPTYYGPMPAVFIYNKNSGAKFAGYASLKGKVKLLLEENPNDVRITYWISKIPEIVDSAKKMEDK